MPVKYVVHERIHPGDKAAPKMFYPMTKSAGTITSKRLANRIAKMSALNKADVTAPIGLMVQVIPEELAEDNIIDPGDFGSFYLTFNATGSEKAGDVNTSNIQRVNLRFRPGPELRKVLLSLKFEKVPDTDTDTPRKE
jgi:predicted histone-like DNA-binding protein